LIGDEPAFTLNSEVLERAPAGNDVLDPVPRRVRVNHEASDAFEHDVCAFGAAITLALTLIRFKVDLRAD
jgi:hypothetical protein